MALGWLPRLMPISLHFCATALGVVPKISASCLLVFVGLRRRSSATSDFFQRFIAVDEMGYRRDVPVTGITL